MRKVAFLLACILSASSRVEAANLPVCTMQGSHDAKVVNFNGADKDTRKGLSYAFVLFPPSGLPKLACLRANFMIGGEVFALMGDGGTSVVRMAIPRDYRKRSIILDGMPYPKAALKWLKENPTGQYVDIPASNIMYALLFVSVEKKEAAFYKFYDRIPDDRELLTAACDALSGVTKPVFVTKQGDGLPEIRPFPKSKAPVGHADCHVRMASAKP